MTTIQKNKPTAITKTFNKKKKKKKDPILVSYSKYEQTTCGTFHFLTERLKISKVFGRLTCGMTLTLIIWERSPAPANSRTIFSSFPSINESKYLMTFGWFSCCNHRMKIKHTSSHKQRHLFEFKNTCC